MRHKLQINIEKKFNPLATRKITVIFHLTPGRMAINTKYKLTNTHRDVDTRAPYIPLWELIQSLWKSIQWSLKKKLKTVPLHDSAIATPVFIIRD